MKPEIYITRCIVVKEYGATATGDMDRNFSDVWAYGFRDTLAERQTQKQRDRQAQGHVHHYTVLSYRRRNDKIFMLKLNFTTRTRHGPDTDKVRARCRVRAKFHYTDPTGPARTQRSFAAKKVRAGSVGSVSGPCSGI